ncbi:Trafficking protein particle complex subunit 12 [Anabarilius grahami]|uniref:Trafficking protein particle complex subunit 12 n=1 Tax=Anabarilius grahami TaxID=495550 RepID=A0A3N0YF39_ANAGA|nr:Trafficking protein particle complex subunit 12 [Anabarilius grahami]
MDSSEGPAHRPVTLDIDGAGETLEASVPPQTDPAEASFQEESIDLDAEAFTSPQDDSTHSVSLMDKLNDQMMESVMISDSPNSEEEDVVPIDSLLGQNEDEDVLESKTPDGDTEERKDDGAAEPEETSEPSQDEENEEEIAQTDDKREIDPLDDPNLESPKAQETALEINIDTSPKEEPVPVCTIFSQAVQPKAQALMPDGFQPTLVKSPSFTIGSSETPNKLIPQVCQPSPSLSKFFTDNAVVNPASDFFDSFTTSTSFISISNPNAELPKTATTPESPPAPGLQEAVPTSTYFTPVATKPQVSPAEPVNKLQAVFSSGDDPFACALITSELDKRYDAWLPSDDTRKVLISVATQQISPDQIDREQLAMPGLRFDNLQCGNALKQESKQKLNLCDLQGDAVKDLMQRFLGDQAAMKRQVLSANSVEQNFLGLKRLIVSSRS